MSALVRSPLNFPVNPTAQAVAGTLGARLGAVVNVEDFPWRAVPGLGVSDAQAALNEAAFQAAIDFIETRGGGTVQALSQFYVLMGDGIQLGHAVEMQGAGVDEWEPVFSSRPKKWGGTSLLFKGTGTRNKTFDGITSMRYAGGWRENPDSAGTYFKLTSFYNADAAGVVPATLRSFSAAVANKAGAHYIGLRDLRIVNWNGATGIENHSDPLSVSLGDEWDIGLLLKDSEYADVENVQVVGCWREFGHLEAATNVAESRSERNRRVRCKFQGRVGVGVRGTDRWDVDATTANTVQIYFSEESYWPAAGSFRGSNGTTYTYTGTTKVGTAFTFTGVAPDPTGIFQVRHAGTGFGNTEFEDCYAYGLYHVSGQTAAALGLANSKPLEASGYPLRGVKLKNFKCHSIEAVVAHLHDAQDFVFQDPQFEGGKHLIASPVNTDATYAAAAVGETRNLVMLGDAGTNEQDLRLFLPRTGFVQGLQVAPRADLTGDAVFKSHRAGKNTVLEIGDSTASFYVRRSGGVDAVRVTDSGNVLVQSGGQITLTGSSALINADAAANIQIRNGTTVRLQVFGASGNVAPGADNTQTCGTSGLRWSTIYAGTGTINTSDEREKTDIGPVPDAILDAWAAVDFVQYRWIDAIEQKGDGARWHFGLIAQRVRDAFAARGLDAMRLGLLCYDAWPDEWEEVLEWFQDRDEEGAPIGDAYSVPTGERRLILAAGERYGVRYDEALLLEAALMRRELQRVRDRA